MKLCVALDLPSKAENLALVRELSGLDIWLKVGLRAYLRDGAKFLDELKSLGKFKIFVDLKIYDIPNTMADSCEVLANLGVEMINLHASAGKVAMSEVMSRLAKFSNRPLVLAVSALTSFDESEFASVYNQKIADAVIKMSENAKISGLDGMVRSVFESLAIKKACGENFITLTPGIRPLAKIPQIKKEWQILKRQSKI